MKGSSAIVFLLASLAIAAPTPSGWGGESGSGSNSGILGSTLGSITDNLSGNKGNGNNNGNGNKAGNGNGNGNKAGNGNSAGNGNNIGSGNKNNGNGNNIGNIGVSPSAPLLVIPSDAIVIAPDLDM